MARASITEVKANLSRFLRMVQRGSEVQIVDRGVPVARLLGFTGTTRGNDSQRVNRLAEAGIIRKGATNLTWLLDESPLDIKSADLASALADDREDRF